MCVLLGTYLIMKTEVFSLLGPLRFGVQTDPALVVTAIAGMLFAVLILLAGLAIAPGTVARRAVAVGIAGGMLIVGAIVAALTFSGAFPSAGPVGLVVRNALLSSLSASFLATLGWLLVRGRPLVTLLFPLVLAVLPVLDVALVFGGASASVFSLVSVPIAAVLGIGAAWAAAALDRTGRGEPRPTPAAAPAHGAPAPAPDPAWAPPVP